jgi:hypothetical protein
MPDRDDHDGVPLTALDPEDAAAMDMEARVVNAEAFAVPAEPGSPVCAFRKRVVVPDANDVLVSASNHLFARFAVLIPTAILLLHLLGSDDLDRSLDDQLKLAAVHGCSLQDDLTQRQVGDAAEAG